MAEIQPSTNLSSSPVNSRVGTSSIGTSNPNTGSVGNTNSSYGPGNYTSGIAETVGTSYTLNDTDYQGIVQFNTSSAVTVSLNSSVKPNFSADIVNLGAGAITLSPTLGYMVNGVSSLTLASGQGCTVYFANRAWTAFVGSAVLPPEILTGTTGSIGGSPLTLGQTATGTATVTGATTAMVAIASPVSSPGSGFVWDSYVSSANTVTVVLTCIVAGTPGATTFNCRVIQ